MASNLENNIKRPQFSNWSLAKNTWNSSIWVVERHVDKQLCSKTLFKTRIMKFVCDYVIMWYTFKWNLFFSTCVSCCVNWSVKDTFYKIWKVQKNLTKWNLICLNSNHRRENRVQKTWKNCNKNFIVLWKSKNNALCWPVLFRTMQSNKDGVLTATFTRFVWESSTCLWCVWTTERAWRQTVLRN